MHTDNGGGNGRFVARLKGLTLDRQTDAVFMVDNEDNLTYLNRAARQLFGCVAGKALLKYDDLLTRLKASRVDGLLSNVEKAANGEDGVRLDWRASQWLLQVIAPEFREDKGQATPAPVVNVAILDSLSRMVYAVDSPPTQPIALPADKASGQT